VMAGILGERGEERGEGGKKGTGSAERGRGKRAESRE